MASEKNNDEQPNSHEGSVDPTQGEELSVYRCKWAGLSLRLWIALAIVALTATAPYGISRAMRGAAHHQADWQPTHGVLATKTTQASQQASTDPHLLISWGSSTGNQANQFSEQFHLLQVKLTDVQTNVASAKGAVTHWHWFPRIETLAAGEITTKSSKQAEIAPDCLAVYLSPTIARSANLTQTAINRIRDIACNECGIPAAAFHVGGPLVEPTAASLQTGQLLTRLTPFAMLLSLVVVQLVTRNSKLTAGLFLIACSTASLSLARIYYSGLFEQTFGGSSAGLFYRVDSLTAVLPLLAYLFSLTSGIYFLSYYRQTCSTNENNSAWQALTIAWKPIVLATATSSLGFISLTMSDFPAVQRFGLLAAINLGLTATILLLLLPAMLDWFSSNGWLMATTAEPLKKSPGATSYLIKELAATLLPKRRSYHRVGWFSAGYAGLLLLILVGIGSIGLPTSNSLFDSEHTATTDIAWFTTTFGTNDLQATNGVLPEVIAANNTNELSRSLQLSSLITTLTIACLMIGWWNSSSAGLAMLVPTIMATSIMLATCGWLGFEWGLGLLVATAGTFGWTFGNTIHFMHWFGLSLQQADEPNQADRSLAIEEARNSARAPMRWTSLLLFVGFAPLTFSTVLPLQQLGMAAMLMVGSSLIMNRYLLPALLRGPMGTSFEVSLLGDQQAVEPEATILLLPAPTKTTANETQSDSHVDEAEWFVERQPLSDADLLTEAIHALSAEETVNQATAAEPQVIPFETVAITPEEAIKETTKEKASEIDSSSDEFAKPVKMPLNEDLSATNAALRERLRRLRRKA